MSTVAEPTAEETKPAPEKPPESGLGQMGSLLSSLKVVKDGVQVKPEEKPPEVVSKEEPTVEKPAEKTEEPKVEPKVEPKKEEPKVEKTPSEATRANFAKLETEKKEAQKLAEAASKERDELRTRIQELEQKTQEAPDVQPYVAAIQQRDQVIEQLRTELRGASIERDPAFVDKYVKGREKRVNELKNLARAAGASEEDFANAMRYGNEDKLAEWRDGLTASQKNAWDAHQSAISNIDFERRDAIENSQKTWEELQERRNAEAYKNHEQTTRERQRTAEVVASGIFKGLREQAPDFSDEELQSTVTKQLKALAGGEGAENWTAENIMRHVGFAFIQSRVLEAQKSVIEGHAQTIEQQTAELTELRKKVEEQETFIKGVAGGMPRSEGGSTSNGQHESGSLLKDVKVRVHR